MVLLLFFCSGVTGLVYEVFWSKYLTLMFGSTMHAQTVVLAVFMGGLALGNRIFGHRADKASQPLALYGYLELIIGLYAFCFHWFYQFADTIFTGLGSKILERTGWLILLKAVLSVGLLLGPTILMGGTLPVLAAWLQRRYPDAGRWSARFYSVNSLGAVLGAAAAGFLLVRWLGMVTALQMTALLNVIIGFAAIGLSRMQEEERVERGAWSVGKEESPSPGTLPLEARGQRPEVRGQEPPSPQGGKAEIGKSESRNAKQGSLPQNQAASSALWLGAALVTVTGAVSMGLEVLSSRALSMIFGASLQAFAIVLMAFILGIGVGGAVMASPRVRQWPRELTTLILLLLAAGLLGVYVYGIEQWVEVYRYMVVGLARTETGYFYHLALNALIALVILGLPAALLGAVLPLWIREGAGRSTALGGQVGRLLTWNTLGAVGGVLVTGFFLMPIAGLRNSFGILALLLGLVALVLAATRICRWSAMFSAVVCGLLLLVCLTGSAGWRYVLSSGVFRARETEVDAKAMETRKKFKKILFYQDAADATVSVEESLSGATEHEISLRINGKPDATSRGDLSTQYLLAHLPMLARPESQDIFVLGFGSGITAGALLGHPIRHLAVAENCAAVLRAAPLFGPWNRGVLTNALTHVWREDARTVLKLSSKEYDVIISEPSNPWTAGIGSVFSREFFEIAASRLKEGGIMAQWFHVYEMNDAIVALVLRTFGLVFPHMEIWDASSGDIVLLGSKRAWKSSPDVYRQVLAREQPRKDLETIGLRSAEAIWARQLASQRTAFAIPGDGPVQSDEFPVLEYEAPKAFYIGKNSRLTAEYDERTWQADLAPEGKRAVMSSLGDATLREIFTEYNSVNPDLAQFFTLRFRKFNPTDYTEIHVGRRLLPCVFRAGDGATNRWANAAGITESERRMWQAEDSLQAQPEKRRQAITDMAGLIRAYRAPDYLQRSNAWAPTFYAALAARVCIKASDWEGVQTMLSAGLEADSSDNHLLYLARILQREMPLKK